MLVSQATLTNTFRPVGMVTGCGGLSGETETEQETSLSATDLTQNPAVGVRETVRTEAAEGGCMVVAAEKDRKWLCYFCERRQNEERTGARGFCTFAWGLCAAIP